jgi:amidase
MLIIYILQDMFMIKGQFASVGYASYLKKPKADENSVIIDILLEGGAVLYCKTTVPQGLFVSLPVILHTPLSTADRDS